jgi:DNA polymerase-1
MPYRSTFTFQDLQTYLSGAAIVAFDFETAPDDEYKNNDRAALDVHKSHIVGISFSVTEGDAIYLPRSYLTGENAYNQDSSIKNAPVG